MAIKFYTIAFIAFMSSLCFADVAKLKTITVVTNLVYDTGIARRNSCVVAPNYAKNRFVYWNTSDTNTALWAAVLYSRYELAEHYIPVERRTVFTISDFAVMQSVDYFINHVCVTNMDAEVFTFAVENPGIRNPGRFALVKFTEGGLFLYAVYVNLATGKADLDFYEISEANLLLSREVTFPYLTKQECRYQRHIIEDVKGPPLQDRITYDRDARFNMCVAHRAPKGWFRMGLAGCGEFFDYSFGRTNFCDETSFEVYEDQVKYLCVTNSMTPNNHHFDRIDLLHDADSRKLLKIRLSRNLPSGVSDIKCIEALKSILKGCEYWYNIKMPALDIADFSKLRNNSEPDTKEWRVEDNSFLIRLSILFEKSDVARIELHIESKKARRSSLVKLKRDKDVEVEIDL